MTTGSERRTPGEPAQMRHLYGEPATLDSAHSTGKGGISHLSDAMPTEVAVMFSLLIKQMDRLRERRTKETPFDDSKV